MSFAVPRTSPSELYSNLKILKFSDIVLVENIQLLYNLYKKRIPESLVSTFAVNFSHEQDTRAEKVGLINLTTINTTGSGLYSIRYHSIKSWNDLQLSIPIRLFDLYFYSLKSDLKMQLLNFY